ncbi:heat shock protein DDB_G0288861-like [Clytia hemisphaerica]
MNINHSKNRKRRLRLTNGPEDKSLVSATKKRKFFKAPLRVGGVRISERKATVQQHINRRKKLFLARRRYKLFCKRSQKRGLYTTRTIKRGLQLMQMMLRDISRPQKASGKAVIHYDFHAEQEKFAKLQQQNQAIDNIGQPMASKNSSEQPMASENSSEQPMASENSSKQPMASENSSEQPMASKNFSEQPMESKNSSEQPMESENSSEQPMESEDLSEQPMVSEDLSEQSMRCETYGKQPIRSESYGKQQVKNECEEEPMDIDHHEHNEVEPMEVDEEEMSAEQFHSLYQRYLQLQQERAKVENNPFITAEKKRVMIERIQHEYNIVMNGNPFPPPNNQFDSPPNNPFNSPPNKPFNSPPNNQFNSPPNNQFKSPPNNPFNSPPNNQFNSPPNNQFNSPPNNQFNSPPNNQFNSPPNNQFKSPPNNPFKSPPNNPFNSPPNNQFNSPPNNQFNSPPNNPFNSPPQDTFRSPPQDIQKTSNVPSLFTASDNGPQTFQQAVDYFNRSEDNIPFASKERWDRFESFGSRFMIDSTYPNDIEMEDLSEEPVTADHIEQDHREEMKYDNYIEMEDLSQEPLPISFPFHQHGEEVKAIEEQFFTTNNTPHQSFAQRMDSPNCQIIPQLHVSPVNPNSAFRNSNLDIVTARNGHYTIDDGSNQIRSFIPCKEPAAYPNNKQAVKEEKITSKAAKTNQSLQDNLSEENILVLQKEIENKKSLLKFLKTEVKSLKKEAFPNKDKKKLIENEMNDAAKDLSKLKRKLPKSLRPIRLPKNDGKRKMERSLVGAGFDGDCASSFEHPHIKENLSPPSTRREDNLFINTHFTRRFQ